jgi:Dihydroorotase
MARKPEGYRFEIPTPDDFHVHLRRGPAMGAYARAHARVFGRAMVMPNTVPAIASTAGIEEYRAEIAAACEGSPSFEPLMCFKLLPGMGAETVLGCASAGAIAGKYYPAGSTTNSADGVSDPSQVDEALGAMEEAGIVLSIHAEDPSAPVLERESAFIPVLERILAAHPRLKMVVEHISTAALLDYVLSGPERVAGGITAHHLLLSLDDLMGESLNPHLHCKPSLKGPRDRDALREAVFRGEGKLFFGSDSAPHPRAAKERGRAASGIYSAPCAVEALAGLFDEAGALVALAPFLAARGADFYGLPRPTGLLSLEKKPWTLPAESDGVVPMLAGMKLGWSAVRFS